MAVGIRHTDHVAPLYPQRLALASPTSGGRSVCTVRSQIQAKEFFYIPISTPHTYDFVVLNSFIQPRKILLVVL
jgi:hypothetical protein